MNNQLEDKLKQIGEHYYNSIEPPDMSFIINTALETKQRSKNYFKIRTTAIIAVVLVFLLLCGFTVKYLYFDNIYYFNGLSESEHVCVFEQQKKQGDFTVTLQAAFSDGISTYAKFKIDGPIEKLEDSELAKKYNTEDNNITFHLWEIIEKQMEDEGKRIELSDEQNNNPLANKVSSACILKSEEGIETVYNFRGENIDYISSNSKISTLDPVTFSKELKENEMVIAFDGVFNYNESFSLRLGLNGIKDAFQFDNLSLKPAPVIDRDVSGMNIAIEYPHAMGKITNIRYTILQTILTVEWTVDENYLSAESDYIMNYMQTLVFGEHEEYYPIMPISNSGERKLICKYPIQYKSNPNEVIELREYLRNGEQPNGKLNRVLCTIPPEK